MIKLKENTITYFKITNIMCHWWRPNFLLLTFELESIGNVTHNLTNKYLQILN